MFVATYGTNGKYKTSWAVHIGLVVYLLMAGTRCKLWKTGLTRLAKVIRAS